MSNNVRPNLSEWFEVPVGATIPAGTPYWRVEPGTDRGYYVGRGLSYDRDLRGTLSVYYTEQPIHDLTEASIWERAERMYSAVYPSLDDAWGWHSQDTKDHWYNLAKKYVEKEN